MTSTRVFATSTSCSATTVAIGPDYCDDAVEQMLTELRARKGSIHDESALDYPEGKDTAYRVIRRQNAACHASRNPAA